MITDYSSNRYFFLRKISSSSFKWADESILVIKASSVKLNMDPNCHGLLSEEVCWQYNAGCTTSQYFVNICQMQILYKIIASWKNIIEDFAGIFGSSHAVLQYFIFAVPCFLCYSDASCTLYLDYFSKSFKISTVTGQKSLSDWNKFHRIFWQNI